MEGRNPWKHALSGSLSHNFGLYFTKLYFKVYSEYFIPIRCPSLPIVQLRVRTRVVFITREPAFSPHSTPHIKIQAT
jgi:hypothetical protein